MLLDRRRTRQKEKKKNPSLHRFPKSWDNRNEEEKNILALDTPSGFWSKKSRWPGSHCLYMWQRQEYIKVSQEKAKNPIYFQRHMKVHVWRKVLTHQRWMNELEGTDWRKLSFGEKRVPLISQKLLPTSHSYQLFSRWNEFCLVWHHKHPCDGNQPAGWADWPNRKPNKIGNFVLDLSLLSSFHWTGRNSLLLRLTSLLFCLIRIKSASERNFLKWVDYDLRFQLQHIFCWLKKGK